MIADYVTKENFTVACAVAFVVLCIRIYFEPSIAAYRNKHTDMIQIFIANVLFSWTLVFWFITWFWACSQDNRES